MFCTISWLSICCLRCVRDRRYQPQNGTMLAAMGLAFRGLQIDWQSLLLALGAQHCPIKPKVFIRPVCGFGSLHMAASWPASMQAIAGSVASLLPRSLLQLLSHAVALSAC